MFGRLRYGLSGGVQPGSTPYALDGTMILIVAVKGDLHAHAVQNAVRNSGYHDVYIAECDQISGNEALSWGTSINHRASILTTDGKRVPVEDLDLIWWRRVNANQEASAGASSDHHGALVNHDCRGTLSGVLAASFHGAWISTPEATTRAADKIFQLTVARQEGMRVPETLVSQSKDEVLAFAERIGRVIVKPVVGAPGPLIFTQYGDNLTHIPAQSFRSAPAVYQEYIEGERHIRLNCFGDELQAALIQTSALDWRPDLNVPISAWEVSDELAVRIRQILQVLGLRMGVIDIKLTPTGEPVWLEVNPQGQFLFLEPILGIPLATMFASFLISSAEGPSRDVITS